MTFIYFLIWSNLTFWSRPLSLFFYHIILPVGGDHFEFFERTVFERTSDPYKICSCLSRLMLKKIFYLRLKAAFVSFLLIWLKVIFFVKDSEVSFATLRLLGMTLVPLISHWTSLLVNWFSSDNCKQYYKCVLLNGITDNRIPKLYWALNCKHRLLLFH